MPSHLRPARAILPDIMQRPLSLGPQRNSKNVRVGISEDLTIMHLQGATKAVGQLLSQLFFEVADLLFRGSFTKRAIDIGSVLLTPVLDAAPSFFNSHIVSLLSSVIREFVLRIGGFGASRSPRSPRPPYVVTGQSVPRVCRCVCDNCQMSSRFAGHSLRLNGRHPHAIEGIEHHMDDEADADPPRLWVHAQQGVGDPRRPGMQGMKSDAAAVGVV